MNSLEADLQNSRILTKIDHLSTSKCLHLHGCSQDRNERACLLESLATIWHIVVLYTFFQDLSNASPRGIVQVIPDALNIPLSRIGHALRGLFLRCGHYKHKCLPLSSSSNFASIT